MNAKRLQGLFLALFCVLCALPAIGQTGRFTGQVTDSSGAAIPAANIQIINQETLVKRETVSDASGNYSLAFLPAAAYQVIVQAGSFNTFIGEGVALGVDQTVVYNIQLTVGSTSTEVNVEGGGATEINTQNAEVGGTVTSVEIATLALNGRNFTQLVTMTPGVSNQSQQDEALVGPVGQAKYSFNGGRTEYNSFEIDGSDVLNLSIYPTAAPLIVNPSLDSLQEIKVLTSNYGAQYGRTASGVVLATTKSGSSTFHGNLYEFFRNEFFNARNYFDPPGHAPLYRRNDFGGTIGGPITIPNFYNTNKSKSFFFFSEEARIEKTPTDYRVAAPDANELVGNFAEFCPPNNGAPSSSYPYCPNGYTGTAASGTPAAFKLSNGDANMYAILGHGLIPMANSRTGCSSSISLCYVKSVSPETDWREELFRIDHDINANNRLSLRYIHDAWHSTVLSPQWGYLGSANTYPTVQNTFTGPGLNALVSLSSAITPSLLNSFVFSYTDSKITLADVGGQGSDLARPAQLDAATCNPAYLNGCGIGSYYKNGYGGKIPGFTISGVGSDLGGGNILLDTGYMPWEHTSPTYNFTDNVTKTLGKHNLQAGTQVIWLQRNQTNSAVGVATGDVQGLINFENTTNNTIGGLLGGDFISSYQQDSAQGRFHQQAWIGEPYVQDDWKVTRRLTINAGLRVSLFGNFYDRGLSLYNWVPSAFNYSVATESYVDPSFGFLQSYQTGQPVPRATSSLDPRIGNGLVHCGYNGVPASCMAPHLWNPAPRVGFAYDITGRGTSSLRAGYGLFYEHGTPYEANSGSLEANPPAVTSVEEYNVPGANGTQLIAGSGPGAVLFPLGAAAFPISVTSIPQTTHWAYAQQWNLNYQQQLPHSVVVTIGYVGSRGTHLTAERQLNQLLPVPSALNPYALHQPFLPADCVSSVINGVQLYTNNLALACASAGSRTGGANYPLPPSSTRVFAPGLDKIASVEPIASSSYHSFQFLGRRTKGPLTLDLAYTYSHSLDDSSDRTEVPVDGLNIQANKASSSFDQRHLLQVSYIYRLPLFPVLRGFRDRLTADPTGAAAPIGGSSAPPTPGVPAAISPDPNSKGSSSSFGDRMAHLLLDHWDLSGLTLVQSGSPFSVYNSGKPNEPNNPNVPNPNNSPNSVSALDNAGVGNGLSPLYESYPDLVGKAKSGIHAAQRAGGNNPLSFGPLLLNPAAFAAPRGLTFGDAGRNVLNNPHRTNFDVSLLKHISLPHEADLEFRAEAFNVFNHTQFRIYDPSQGNTPSNTVSCYAGANAQYSAAGGGGTNCYSGSSFLHPYDAHRARTGQLGLKLSF